MPGDLNYTEEAYSYAAQVLDLTDKSPQERLIQAYVDHAMHAFPPGAGLGPQMSPELSERVAALHRRLTLNEAGVEETPHSRIGAMSDDEINDAIGELLAIAELARRERYGGDAADERAGGAGRPPNPLSADPASDPGNLPHPTGERQALENQENDPPA